MNYILMHFVISKQLMLDLIALLGCPEYLLFIRRV